jgi:TIR domain
MSDREYGPSGDNGPLFFLSYAHSADVQVRGVRKHAHNGRFIKFFEDISVNVAELVTRPAGSDPGYMDSRSIPDGGRWSAELLTAVGSCQVFVALLSPRYFVSRWCGMEWHAFSQRQVYHQSDGSISDRTTIIPVIWAPIREPDVPSAVGEIQRFSPREIPNADIAGQYEHEGVVGLLQLNNNIAYQAVVWRIAQRIAEFHYSYHVKPRQYKLDELRNVFEKRAV